MLRAILLPELKRSLIQKAVIIVPGLVGIALLEYGAAALGLTDTVKRTFNGDIGSVMDMLLSVFLIFFAFLLGTGAFSRINERHIPFLHALPLSRLEVWVAFATAHAVSALVAIPAILTLRPSLWRGLTADVQSDTLPIAAGVCLAVFAAGTCFVMLFRSLVTATVAGAFLVAASCGVIVPFAAAFRVGTEASRYYRRFGNAFGSQFRIDPLFWLLACAVLALIYFGLSLWFFTHGEFNLTRRRLKNWAVLVPMLLAFPLVLAGAIDARSFLPTKDDKTPSVAVSANGEYVAIVESSSEPAMFSKISIIETSSGKVVNTFSFHGPQGRMGWSGTNKPVLNILRIEFALERMAFLLPPSDSILRLSPDGGPPSKIKLGFAEIDQMDTDPANRLWMAAQSGGRVKLLSVSEDGVLHEELNTPLKDGLEIEKTGARMLFWVRSDANGLEHGWSLTPNLTEIPYAPKEKSHAEAQFLFDDGWYSDRGARAALESRFNLKGEIARRGPNTEGDYFVSREYGINVNVLSLDRTFALVYDKTTGKREILVSSTKTNGWRSLGDAYPVSSYETEQRNAKTMATYYAGSVANAELGFATYWKREGPNSRLFLYDVALDRSFELASASSDKDLARCDGFRRESFPGLDAILLSCQKNRFAYKPGVELRPLALKGSPIFARPDGSYFDSFYDKNRDRYLYYVSADGTRQQLWPVR